MRGSRLLLLTLSILVGAGCSKNNPTFSVLDQNVIPQPTFAGQTTKTFELDSLVRTTALAGECDPRVRGIQATVVGVSGPQPLDSISVGAATVDCANSGKFSFTLKNILALVPGAQGDQTLRIELRSETMGGLSNPTLLTVTYVKAVPERWRLTSGGTESGSAPRGMASVASGGGTGNFRADLRVTHFVNAADATSGPNQTTATSSHFQLRYGRAEQTH